MHDLKNTRKAESISENIIFTYLDMLVIQTFQKFGKSGPPFFENSSSAISKHVLGTYLFEELRLTTSVFL